jgi:hypothetical protein
MPAAVGQPIRDALWAAAQHGLSTAALAERFRLPARTVRRLLQQGRQHGAIPAAAYRTVAPRDRAAASEVFRLAWELKEAHPDWGARFLLGVLAKSLPGQTLPSERTLRRWLRQQSRPAAPAGRRRDRLPRAQQPHQRWQVDACDQLTLAEGGQISWLRGADECTGAVLGTVVFPPRAI